MMSYISSSLLLLGENMKQVIIIRKDLNMRKGKMVAQGSHACLLAYLNTPLELVKAWFANKQVKICVGVDSEAELLELYKRASDDMLVCSLVLDAGLTEFKEPTYTAVAIGPGHPDSINRITGHLKLL